MLLRRTVFDKPATAFAVDTIEAPTREVKVIDPASRAGREPSVVADPEEPESEPGDPSPEVEGDPELPSEPEATEPESPQYWSEYGVESEAEFRQMMAHQRQAAQQAEQYRQHAAVLWQLNENQRQAQLRQQQQVAPAAPQLPWTIPQGYTPDMESLLSVDDAGNIIAKPGVDPRLPQLRQEWLKAQQSFQQQMLSDPHGLLKSLGFVTREEAQQQIHQIAQQQIFAYHRKAAEEKFATENGDWLFDAPGVLSPAGNLWNQHYTQALQAGYADPIGYATNVVDAAAFREQVNSAAQAEANGITPDANALKKRALLTAGKKPNRTGSFRKPGKSNIPPQNGAVWADLRKKISQLPPDDLE